MPGAVNVKYTDLFREDGYLKSNDELKRVFKDVNLNEDDKIIAYCTAGVRAAYVQLIMEMLDYDLVKNFDASYTWCANNLVE